uniref:Uncharacterized protein n=1 Tax=Panagrolaimus davidi TaxID=227884 RepID=A0A914QYZ6_9BILA
MKSTETKECSDDICYSFVCINPDNQVMVGSGCYEDFVNTCKFIQSKITENAKENKTYKYYDENVVVVSCSADGSADCARKEVISLINLIFATFLEEVPKEILSKNGVEDKLSDSFGDNHEAIHSDAPSCTYNNSALPTKSEVKCLKGGQCLTNSDQYNETAFYEYPYVVCSECVAFECSDNDRVMRGYGCLEDFEQICTNVPSTVIEKIKANPKNYFYSDNDTSTIIATCSYDDYCHLDAVNTYGKSLPFGFTTEFSLTEKFNDEENNKTCSYESLSGEIGHAAALTGNGVNGFTVSGMIIFGFIFIYLLW